MHSRHWSPSRSFSDLMTIWTSLGPAMPPLPTSQRFRHFTTLGPWTANSHGHPWTLILTTASTTIATSGFGLGEITPTGSVSGLHQVSSSMLQPGGAVFPSHAASFLFFNPRTIGRGFPSRDQVSRGGNPASQAIPDAFQTGGHASHHSPSHST